MTDQTAAAFRGLTYALNADNKEEASLEWKHLSMRLALLCALQQIVAT